MKIPGFHFDYAIKDSKFKGILKINDEKRFVSRWELIKIASWFIGRAIFPRKVKAKKEYDQNWSEYLVPEVHMHNAIKSYLRNIEK